MKKKQVNIKGFYTICWRQWKASSHRSLLQIWIQFLQKENGLNTRLERMTNFVLRSGRKHRMITYAVTRKTATASWQAPLLEKKRKKNWPGSDIANNQNRSKLINCTGVYKCFHFSTGTRQVKRTSSMAHRTWQAKKKVCNYPIKPHLTFYDPFLLQPPGKV